ncbi:MAG: endopeptidase La [Ferrimonas sp.]
MSDHPINEFNANWNLSFHESSETNDFELSNAQPQHNKTQVLPAMMLQNRPFFPEQIMPVLVKGAEWGSTLKAVKDSEHKLMVLFHTSQTDLARTPVDLEQLAQTGCVVKVHNIEKNENGSFQFVAEGIKRATVTRWLTESGPYLAELHYPSDEQNEDESKEIKAYAITIIKTLKQLLPLNPLYSEELKHYLERFSPNEPAALTDFSAAITSASTAELQQVLDTISLLPRIQKVLVLLKKELETAKLQTAISKKVHRKMDKREREFMLREQLKVIQQELGDGGDDKTTEIAEFRQRIEGLTLPAAVQKRFNDEVKKFMGLESGSPEYAVSRNYLDWLSQIPWSKFSQDSLDLTQARKILDKHHDGINDVKDRIIEFLAVGSYKGLNDEHFIGIIDGSIILLVGPPGVGKTSIGKSIADCLNRPFYRFSVGGMRDEAEIKGHRRTYIGAMPGKLAQGLKECGVMNPVIMLDEIDKIGQSYQGDPASALLETLDPEQNSEFLDHYLDVRMDLSKVLFVCTANSLDSIPGPLLDRMETIRLSGYLAEEKLAIAKHHLWPKQLKKAGLKRAQLRISDAALRSVIEGYAREAGVRSLEKQLAKLVRKSVVKLLQTDASKLSIGLKDIESMLGLARFKDDQLLNGVGIVTGLAWTSMGGATLPVEARLIHRQSRNLTVSGQLGKVMKESATIAHNFISGYLAELDKRLLDADADADADAQHYFDNAFVHLHVPDGATPKDGPSAGITMATALLSLALNKAPSRGFAMTGELSLTGQVMPVGGIREKVISAKRQKIQQVILPEANRSDFNELPDYIKEGLQVHFASVYQDVANLMFENHS